MLHSERSSFIFKFVSPTFSVWSPTSFTTHDPICHVVGKKQYVIMKNYPHGDRAKPVQTIWLSCAPKNIKNAKWISFFSLNFFFKKRKMNKNPTTRKPLISKTLCPAQASQCEARVPVAFNKSCRMKQGFQVAQCTRLHSMSLWGQADNHHGSRRNQGFVHSSVTLSTSVPPFPYP